MSHNNSRPTEIDDNYETCTRALATLQIYGLDPDWITSQLGITPSDTQRRGEVKTIPSGKTRITPHHGWFLSTENHVQSKDIRRHLDWLLGRLLPAKDALRALQGVAGAAMRVNCIWWSTGDGGPTLWPEQMRGLSELDLECSFDVWFCGEGDDPSGRPEPNMCVDSP
jgi:hypothetical protein